MLFELDDNLLMGEETSYTNKNGTIEEAVILRDGVNKLVCSAENAQLLRVDRPMVNYTATLPLKFASIGDNAQAMADMYYQQAAMITRHSCVPIPTFSVNNLTETLDPDLTLRDSVGYWYACICDTMYDEPTDTLTVHITVMGQVFADALDPQGLIKDGNADEHLMVKPLFVDMRPNAQEIPPESPYSICTIGVANVANVTEPTVSADQAILVEDDQEIDGDVDVSEKASV